jgi:hypothetical protein
MKISQKQYFTLIIAIVSLILLYIIFKMIEQLIRQQYIVECFSNNNQNQTIMDKTLNKYLNQSTSYSVDLPLTTTYTCQNFCGPNARCATTGQQCLADIDCPGCQAKSTNQLTSKKKKEYNVPANDDAGKLTVGLTPQYSPLTTGYGTKEKIVTDDLYARPLQANFGVDTWGESFNEGQILFNKRYRPNQLQNMPNYPPMYSITGEFINDGPLPSNY